VLELAALGVAMVVLDIRWHVYDALVVPVLIGITLDESMFLLHAARAKTGDASITHAIRTHGPLVASTALTTAAGFLALLPSKFDGLVDLGAVGALGTGFGLLTALVVVPAGLRVAETFRRGGSAGRNRDAIGA
jgi:predicted RND superfamily exporter protein